MNKLCIGLSKSMDRKEFSRQRDELQEEVFNALLSYKVYISSWPTEEFIDVINRYKGFFQPIRYSLYYTWIMGLAKIFDQDSRTVSLINLIDTAINNKNELIPKLSHKEILQLKEQLLHHNATLAKIKDLRDQYFAHHDQHPKQKLKITIGEIDNLAKILDKVFNGLSSGHDGNIFNWSFQEDSSSRTTSDVLNVLKDKMVRKKKKAKRIIRDIRMTNR